MKELSQREAAFAVHFTTIGSDTFSDGKKSAVAAGYSEKSAQGMKKLMDFLWLKTPLWRWLS